MTAERPLGPDITGPKEILLTGKTAIVTGGSRDVGRGIVEALAAEGVRVIFSYNNKTRRANEVLAGIEQAGGEAYAIGGDTSTPEGRDAFFASASEISGRKVDFLILSSSGSTPELNEGTSQDLLKKFLPQMNNGGTVIKLQSVPGNFLPQLDGSFSLGEYDSVAINKYADLRALRKKMPEMEKHGARFLVICPPIVSGTNNVRFANRINPRAEELHYLVSDRLGLPRSVTPEQVGEKIVELLKNPDIENGHTEYFNGVLDTQTVLEQWYGIPQVYVNTLEILEEIDGQKHAIGRAIVSLEQTTRPNDPNMIDELSHDTDGSYVGTVRISQQHAEGHFTEQSGLPRILPGHKQIRAVVDTIGLIENQLGNMTGSVRLAGFEHAKFERFVIADGNTTLMIKPIKNGDGTWDVKILRKNDREQTTFIKGLRVWPGNESSEKEPIEDLYLEGAAQASGLVGLNDAEGDGLPLLQQIGRTEFLAGGIQAGEGIKYDTISQQIGKRRVQGSVVVYSEGRIIGAISGIRAVLVPRRAIPRLLK